MIKEKGFNKQEFIGKLFNRFFWFMIIFGIMDLVLFKRPFGWVALIGGISLLVIHWMKKNKKGPFKPQPKTLPKATGSPINEKISIARVIIALVIISCLGFGLMYVGWNWNQQVNQAMHEKCKMCSWGQKDCPYTQEELEEEEWSNGPCGDMGLYELLWKGSMMVCFIGIAWVGIGIYMTYQSISLISRSHSVQTKRSL